MLGAQIFVDVLKQLLISSGGLGRVQIASASNVTIGCVEVESTRDGLELLDGEVL